jgi:4-methyl-5(b-hydroxyethyl)-thiazole monophosphate biosynthesis
MTVIFLLANGFEETELIAPVDILRRAGANVELISIEENLLVESSHGIKIEADNFANQVDLNAIDAVVLPGGLRGTDRLSKSPKVEKIIRTAHDNGKFVGAICAAPMVLGKLGLLEGKSFTCYPGIDNNITDGLYTKKNIVHEDNIITAEAMGSSMEFGFKLTELLYGKEVEKRIRNEICYRDE